MKVGQLFHIDPTSLVLVGNWLDPIAIHGLLLPGPLGLTEGVEVVAVPDIQAETQLRVTPLHHPIEFAIEVFIALEPEALPDQHLRVAQQHTQELDQCPIDKGSACTGALEVEVELTERSPGALHIDTLFDRFTAAVFAEAAWRLPLNHAVERTIALVTPHDPVDIVVPALILNQGVPPASVGRVRGTGLTGHATVDIHLKVLGHVGDLHGTRRPVTGILEEWLHHLGDDLHPPCACGRDD